MPSTDLVPRLASSIAIGHIGAPTEVAAAANARAPPQVCRRLRLRTGCSRCAMADADGRTSSGPWKLFVTLVIIAVLGLSWRQGRLDRFMPVDAK